VRSYAVTEIWDISIRVNASLLVFLPILAWLIGSGQQIELYAGLIEGFTGAGFDLGRCDPVGHRRRGGRRPVRERHAPRARPLWVALRYGIEIESITLWILGGITALSSLPKEWDREFWIAIAGPITSVLVDVVCYAAALVAPESLQVSRFVVGYLALTNLLLAGFNLLPAFPMGDGRIFRALLARSRPYGTATRTAARVGVLFAFLFGIVGVLNFRVTLILLAFFIYGAAPTAHEALSTSRGSRRPPSRRGETPAGRCARSRTGGGRTPPRRGC
jgi:hypothetical protein